MKKTTDTHIFQIYDSCYEQDVVMSTRCGLHVSALKPRCRRVRWLYSAIADQLQHSARMARGVCHHVTLLHVRIEIQVRGCESRAHTSSLYSLSSSIDHRHTAPFPRLPIKLISDFQDAWPYRLYSMIHLKVASSSYCPMPLLPREPRGVPTWFMSARHVRP